jgi:ATP-dependent Clp protease ATP-binding subunit ClpC
MTSNAGTRDVKKSGTVGFGKDSQSNNYEAMKSKIMDELKRIFNPEFLNRVDETIVFAALTKKEIAQIVEIQLAEVAGRLVERNISMDITKEVKAYVVDQGFDPILGARPLRRAIQRLIEDPMSEEFLNDRFGDGDTIRIELKDEKIVFLKVETEHAAP